MSLCKRIVARLDVKGNRLIKGIRFEGLRVIGDPLEHARLYAQAGADEILFVDAVASLYGRNSLIEILRQTTRDVFIPITAGGGVRSVSDAAALLAAGADKVAVNTAAINRPALISELAHEFGSQCVVASIQARRVASSAWEAMTESGREKSGKDVLRWIKELQKLGAGEILLTSVDQDGTNSGPDLNLLDSISSATNVPVIFGGGLSTIPQIDAVLNSSAVSAVSIGASLHNKRLSISEIKHSLIQPSSVYSIRDTSKSFLPLDLRPLNSLRLGVIDYGMGNQQSLINALEYLGADVLLSDQKPALELCDLLLLPGVGSFPAGMAALRRRELDCWLVDWVQSGNPLIGICLGMQMLFDSGEEFQLTPGLSMICGEVKLLPETDKSGMPVLLPHLGWNKVTGCSDDPLSSFSGLNQCFQYFVHSFSAKNVESEAILYRTYYADTDVIAAVKRDNLIGFQFHPERSGWDGLAILSAAITDLTGN